MPGPPNKPESTASGAGVRGVYTESAMWAQALGLHYEYPVILAGLHVGSSLRTKERGFHLFLCHSVAVEEGRGYLFKEIFFN